MADSSLSYLFTISSKGAVLGSSISQSLRNNIAEMMYVLTFSLLLSLVSAQPQSRCSPVHIIVCRASGEAPGEGTISSLSSLLKQQIPGATSEALVYPAKIPYAGSIPIGVANLKTAVATYTNSCPAGRLIIIGYSQGAAVLTDTLCGGGGKDVGPVTPGLTAQEGRLIKATVGMGDPRFVPGLSYDSGTNKATGGVSRSRYLRRRRC